MAFAEDAFERAVRHAESLAKAGKRARLGILNRIGRPGQGHWSTGKRLQQPILGLVGDRTPRVPSRRGVETKASAKGFGMDLAFRAMRRSGYALVAFCLVGASGCVSPLSWGINEANSLIHHHHSSHKPAPTKALEAATPPDADETPAV
jgi:hypothetical protein